jgi:hypothetical protein
MDYFTMDDIDSIAYIEENTNNVIIKFYGFPNHTTADLFITYAMLTLGFEYEPLSGMQSAMIH